MDVNPTAQRHSQAQKAAAEAERDANSRVTAAQKRVAEAEREGEKRVEQVRDAYVRQSEKQSLDHEVALQNQRNKSYQQIRDLQRNQAKEMNRARNQGDKDLNTVKQHYEETTQRIENEGESKLLDMENQDYLARQNSVKQSESEMDALRDQQGRRIASLKEEQDRVYGQLTAENKAVHERVKAQTMRATEKSEAMYQERFNETLRRQNESIDRAFSTAANQLEEIRRDSTQKLDAYSSRQSDPFYRMVNINANLDETDTAFILTATIPEHEREGVTVAVKGNQLVISGNRKNSEKLDLELGHSVSTSSFQSFNETFPLNFPVDAKNLRRQFDGDTLTVHVPKKTTYSPEPFRAKQKVERARAERPKFPDNLVSAKTEPPAEPSTAKKRGNRTLS